MANNLEQYEKAAGMMPGSVIIFQLQPDDIMKVFFYSKKARELTGMEQTEVDNTVLPNGFNMIIEDDQRIILEKIKLAVTNHEELDVTYRQHHKVQGVVWIHMKASIAGEIDGLPVFIASMLDVTHEMLNSSSIMEASDRSICVIEKKNKLLLYGNSKFYELIDRKPGDSMGVYCYDALCGNPAFQNDNNCLCFSTINIEKPFEYYNPDTRRYLSMYGREIMWGEHEAYVFYMSDQTEEKFKEKQLKNAQERFELTLENSGLFIWEYDIINSQCINSRKAVREYGIPLVIDNYPESLFSTGTTPPETIRQIKEVKRRLLNGESGFSVERRTINTQGDSQWMRVSYTLEKDSTGRPARALVCGTDITEQKKKEQAYEEELRLKKTVTSDTSILAVLNLTQDQVQENDATSPALAECLALGSINTVMDAVCKRFMVPSDQESYRKHFNREKMLADYERGILHGTLRHQFTLPSGWYESAYDLLLNPSTGDVEAIISMKDVTDTVRTHQVVNKLTAIDYDMIMTIDVASGEAFRMDYEAGTKDGFGKKLSAKAYTEFVIDYVQQHSTPKDGSRFAEQSHYTAVLEKLQTMPVYSFLYTITVDGQVFRKRSIYTYIDESHKTILYARQDVTESYLQEEKQKKELSEALEKADAANHAKTMFLSRVSHDMRTPLNGVLGLTALMKDEVVLPEVLQDLTKLEMSGKYLLDLINDVLDVSSIESGKLELHPSVWDGHVVMNNVVKLIQPMMDEKNIEFALQSSEMVYAPIFIDEARLQQVAMNILGNAAKFTPEGGKVEFTSRTVSIEAEVVVNEFVIKDNGIGMDAAFVPHLFEPFSQENAAITNSKNGTGLGMSITKKIVELMNGSIEVESQKGIGTTVTVVLEFPIATEEQLKAKKAAEQPHAINYHLEGKRILLCEDHPLNAEIAKRILQKVGVVVEHAKNGEVGVEMFKNSAVGYYAAILMDIRMPVMDGLEAARTIRALQRRDALRIPILAMTANALDEDVKNTVEAGMNAHLSKPINPVQLYQNLDKYINTHLDARLQRILLVDDIEMNRALLKKTLSDSYQIFEAENGRQALAVMTQVHSIDLVITDLSMPQMDGIELIKTLRANDKYRCVAIIAYTGSADSEQEEMLLQLGVNDFIYKPSKPKIIKLRVKNAIAARL